MPAVLSQVKALANPDFSHMEAGALSKKGWAADWPSTR